ncbi:transposase IS4 domain-containing protein [Phthorimaea operculella]|nr:transposase IS4 domain-containing protein [Phthorimaea operculella]
MSEISGTDQKHTVLNSNIEFVNVTELSALKEEKEAYDSLKKEIDDYEEEEQTDKNENNIDVNAVKIQAKNQHNDNDVSTGEEVDYEFEEEYCIEREANGEAENVPLIFVTESEEDLGLEIPQVLNIQILSPHQTEPSLQEGSSTTVQQEDVSGRWGRRGEGDSWRQGDQLKQIYLNDEDLPTELKAKLMKIRERRLERQRANDKRNAKRRAARQDNEEGDEEGGDAALFPGDSDALHFDWRPMDTYQGERETFLPQKTGPTTPSTSPYKAFIQYWDKTIMGHIVAETNAYAAAHPEWTGWYDTNIHELYTLFAFWIMTGIVRLPSIRAYFSENPLLYTSCFRTMFTRVRYERLCAALHFNDDTLRLREANTSKTFALDPIIKLLNVRFQKAFVPRQEICIDDSLTPWKGSLSFRQFIRTKSAKFGIKTFELCESSTGYLWSFFVYTGKEDNPDTSLPSSLTLSSKTVVKLVRPLLNKGYTLFMNNSFNSPLLTRFLKRNKTDVVGFLGTTRQHVPELIVQCELQPGQFVARHSGDMTVMAYHDRKKICLISTYHGDEVTLSPPKPQMRQVYKPKLLLDYKKGMRGVDMKDGMLESHHIERKKCRKWNMKLFKRLLNASVLNARICREATAGRRMAHVSFRLQLVDQILKKHLPSVPRRRHPAPVQQPLQVNQASSRFTTNTHWPSAILKRSADGRIARRKCKECKSSTTFECVSCSIGLCIPCFGGYHNRPDPN